MMIARFNTDGTLDNSFSFDGFATYDHGGNIDQATVVRQQSDGKLVVGGYTRPNGSPDSELLLIRFNSDGTFDSSFGTNGHITYNFGMGADECYDLRFVGNDKILTAGSMDGPFSSEMTLVQVNMDGTLDTDFGTLGHVSYALLPSGSETSSMILTPDNKVVVVGSVGLNTNTDFAIVRFGMDGVADNTFGSNGGVSTDFNNDYDRIYQVIMQDDGLLLAVGVAFQGTAIDIALARYISGINIGIGEVETYLGSTLIYPNPIRNSTAILEYELSATTEISVELLATNGKWIAQLLPTETRAAGSHTEQLNLPEVASGNYILNIKTPNGNVGVQLMIN